MRQIDVGTRDIPQIWICCCEILKTLLTRNRSNRELRSLLHTNCRLTRANGMNPLSISASDTPYSCGRLRGPEVVNLRRLFGGSFASGASFRSMRAARESGTAPRGTNVSNGQAITHKIVTYAHPKTTTLPAARSFCTLLLQKERKKSPSRHYFHHTAIKSYREITW